jgi:histone acetyltransferase 1
MTVFHFLSPFKKPKPGTIARVCQVLILPPYQRVGHGKVLLQQLYDIAHDTSNDIVEINVEDPAPVLVFVTVWIMSS